MIIDKLSFNDTCKTFAHPTSLSVPNIQVVFSKPRAYYVASHSRNSIGNEKETLISCSTSLDLDLEVYLISPSIGALEPTLPPIVLSECPFKCSF